MNAFLEVADMQMAAPVKTKHRVAEARAEKAATVSPADKKMREQQKLLSIWRAWRKERLENLLAGPLGKEVKGLLLTLRTLTPESAPTLVTIVQNAKWLKEADKDTRLEVLALVSRAIVRVREQQGLPSFDDAIPGEPLTAYEIIREQLR